MTKIINLIRKCFTQTPNSVIIDQRLSDGAVRLFLYMSSKPDDWSFNNSDIKKQLSIKRDETIAKYFKELISSGWISRTAKIKNGRPSGYFDYIIYPEPIIPATTKDTDLLKKATTENTDTEKPQLPQNSSYNNTELSNNTKTTKINTLPLTPIEKSQRKTFGGDEWLKIIEASHLIFNEQEKLYIKNWGDEYLRVKSAYKKQINLEKVQEDINYLFTCKSDGFNIVLLIKDSIEHGKGFLFQPSYRYQAKFVLTNNTSQNDTFSRRYPNKDYISPQNTKEKITLCHYIDNSYRNGIDPRTRLVLTSDQIKLLKAHFSKENKLNISIYEYIYREEVLKNLSILEQSINDIPASFVVVESKNSDSQNKDK